MPCRSLVDLNASTPPKSLPLWPMWPIASMLGAPCCPLKRITSPANVSWPLSPNRLSVLVWFAAPSFGSRVIEKVGFTPAIGELMSQSCDRSKRRAFCTARMNLSTSWSSSALTSRPTSASPKAPARAANPAVATNLRRPFVASFMSPPWKLKPIIRARHGVVNAVARNRVGLEPHAEARGDRPVRGELHAVHVLVKRQLEKPVGLHALRQHVAHSGAEEQELAAAVLGLGLLLGLDAIPVDVDLRGGRALEIAEDVRMAADQL